MQPFSIYRTLGFIWKNRQKEKKEAFLFGFILVQKKVSRKLMLSFSSFHNQMISMILSWLVGTLDTSPLMGA